MIYVIKRSSSIESIWYVKTLVSVEIKTLSIPKKVKHLNLYINKKAQETTISTLFFTKYQFKQDYFHENWQADKHFLDI